MLRWFLLAMTLSMWHSVEADVPRQAPLAGTYPMWSHSGYPSPQARAVLKVLAEADRFGLRAADYIDCASRHQPLCVAPERALSSQEAARFDAAMSRVVSRFLSDIHFGRIDPTRAGFQLRPVRSALPFDQLLPDLASTADVRSVIASLEPPFEHYRLLKESLQRYRLLATGQLVPSALERSRVPYSKRIRQIELTLERWRWLPSFDAPPIIVNIPQFRLYAFRTVRDRRDEMLQMDVIVGRSYPLTRTPVFTASMTHIVFRPYWDIPSSITQREMLPDIISKPGFLSQQHLELVDGPADSSPVVPPSAENIARLAAGTLRLRQQPGEDNALGLVKFMLPNPYNVYLHSTSARGLFRHARRAFSHGCIRVSDPVALATYALRNGPGEWTPQTITAAMHGVDSRRINLSTPIHVLILYGTALATEDGRVLFFDDIYGHDRRLEKLLGLPPIAGR